MAASFLGVRGPVVRDLGVRRLEPGFPAPDFAECDFRGIPAVRLTRAEPIGGQRTGGQAPRAGMPAGVLIREGFPAKLPADRENRKTADRARSAPHPWEASVPALRILALLLAGAAAFPSQTAAQDRYPDRYPTRPIRLIVAFAAGGTTDFVARLVADKAKGTLGQSVVV